MIDELKRVVPAPARGWLREKQRQLITLLHYLRFRGNRFRCPICGAGLRDFLPLPPSYGLNLRIHGWPYRFDEMETLNVRLYACPFCDASDRNRLCALFLKTHIPVMNAQRPHLILDFAPSRPLSAFIRDQIERSRAPIEYRTADLIRDDVDFRADLMNLDEVGDESCDLFLCSHILEHVADDRRALSELWRILKPGGLGILMVPIVLSIAEIDEDPSVTDEGERWRRFGQEDHVRLYSRQGFTQRVEEAGFALRRLDSSAFGDEAFRRHGISDGSALYVAAKRPAGD